MENSVAQVCTYDNCDLVWELTQHRNVTFTYAAREGLPANEVLVVLSTRNS